MVRFKNRYLLFEVCWKDGRFDDSITEAILLAAFRDSLQQNFGDYGLGCALASFQVKYYNPVSSLCIVRCSRDEYRQVWVSLCLLTEVRHRAVLLRLLHLTGTVAACQKAARVAHVAAIAGRRLPAQQARAADEAEARLAAMAVPCPAMEELSAGTTLFWRAVPVLLRRGERGEERPAELTIRLIAAGQKRGQGVLRCFISSEADPFFLHVLEVGEEEYALLRHDQDIRVDFANFPGKLIGLLDKCIACKDEDLPRFQAVLHATAPPAPTYAAYGHGPAALAASPAASAPSVPSSFRVVENNDFKQLPHICLAFRPGSDAAVKQFLAFRLGELRSDASALSAELERTQGERNSLQTSLGEARRAAAAAREQHERLVLEHEADAKAREAAVLEAKARELADLREAGLRERSEMDAKHREQLEAAQARAASLDAEARALREQKYGLDSRVSELSHKLGASEGSNRSLTEEVERLRAATTTLGREKAERDVELGEALTKVAALEDKVAGQRGLAAEQAQRIKDMEASLRQVEARAEELKAAAQGHEARANEAAAELARANTAVERLGNDLALAREKVRRKAAIIGRQEEELAARDKERDEAAGRARGLAADLERATADAESLRKEVADMRAKLEESRAQVASNEQMIRWLNNQITETQLHYSSAAVAGSGVLASRYSYRPPVTVPHAPSSGSGGAAAPQGLVPSAAAAAAGGRPMMSTYRTPATAGLGSSGSGQASSAAGSTAVLGSTGASATAAPARGPFRSSFYATHFGDRAAAPGGGTGGSSAGAGAAAAPAGLAAARSLDLGSGASPASVGPAPAVAPAGSTPASAATAPSGSQGPAAPSSGAASYLSSRLFEAPTFRMADTAAGRVAVPVTSGS
ncbi:hypothetical protein ABPG75_000327 [Micractinium tetrahymenae]